MPEPKSYWEKHNYSRRVEASVFPDTEPIFVAVNSAYMSIKETEELVAALQEAIKDAKTPKLADDVQYFTTKHSGTVTPYVWQRSSVDATMWHRIGYADTLAYRYTLEEIAFDYGTITPLVAGKKVDIQS